MDIKKIKVEPLMIHSFTLEYSCGQVMDGVKAEPFYLSPVAHPTARNAG
jgi:hypothetical protein